MKKFLFIVQGEGRGHITQAIALQKLISDNGHQVCAALVGKSKRREIPSFFIENMACEVIPFESPNFETDKNNKSIKVKKTIINNLLNTKSYLKYLKKLDAIISNKKPDVIINFYDFLAGMHQLLYANSIPFICIGHQYLLEHPTFEFPKKVKKVDKFFYLLNTKITHHGASKKLALSFYNHPNSDLNNIYVVPPLLRNEVLELKPENKGHLLVYVVNPGFLEDIIKWHEKNSHILIHFYSDNKSVLDGEVINKTLICYHLNDKRFLESMRTCMGYASTAGFESVCEALFLQKPTLVVPPEGHFEQQCNAFDATKTNLVIQNNTFDLDLLLSLIHLQKKPNTIFKEWVLTASQVFKKVLEL